jgi:hypothetical protein
MKNPNNNSTTKDPSFTKNLLNTLPISEFTKTNPIIPPMEQISEGKKYRLY